MELVEVEYWFRNVSIFEVVYCQFKVDYLWFLNTVEYCLVEVKCCEIVPNS